MTFHSDFVFPELPEISQGKKAAINSPMTLDIETSSYYENGQKRATMYIWQMCIGGQCLYGRTYFDMICFFDRLKAVYDLSDKKQAIIYVHNLPYDSQFFLPWFNCTKMFATDTHEPLYFEVDKCLVFKDSLKLSGKSLAKISEDYTAKKQTGFDYSLLRTTVTELSETELYYCEMDVYVLYLYLCDEQTQNDGNILKIPLTKTGYARRYCFDMCKKIDWKKYKSWFNECTPTDPELYDLLQKAFTGGITHANAIYVDIPLFDITNYDLQSDYPSQIVKHKFPATPFVKRDFNFFPTGEDTAYIATVSYINLRSKYTHSVLSYSKCQCLETIDCPLVVDNGRLVSCGNVTTTITDVDKQCIDMFYTYDDVKILTMWTAKKRYLPRQFVLSVLKLYSDKTTLKGIEDKKAEYQLSKGLLNSLYGMCVSRLVREEIEYNQNDPVTVWKTISPDSDKTEEQLKQYRDKWNSFLLYQTGIYITAYARYDLLYCIRAICEAAGDTMNGKPFDDVVYYDTDSIKMLNGSKYKDIFDRFNEQVKADMQVACKHHNIKFDLCNPTDSTGKKQMLGIFDIEKPYEIFKTLGAKRYCYKYYDKDTFNITVAGVNKYAGAEYITEQAEKLNVSSFDIFTNGLHIPAGRTGKQTLTYFDNGFSALVTDYQGHTSQVAERRYIHMENASYNMGMPTTFLDYIHKLQSGGIENG